MTKEMKEYYTRLIVMTKISYKRSQAKQLWTPIAGISVN